MSSYPVPPYELYRSEIVKMACDEGLSNAVIGEKLGFPPQTIRMWLQRPDYKDAIKLYYSILEEETYRQAGTIRAKRIQILQDQLDSLLELKRQRAAAYSHIETGGSTGNLVKEVKTVGTGPNAYDVAEYKYDSAVVRDIAMLTKQIAQEKGEWSEKSTHDITITETVKVIRFEAQERPPDESIEASYYQRDDDAADPADPTDPA